MERLVPLMVDGLIYASSMVIPDAARWGAGGPALARGCSAWVSWRRSRPTWYMAWGMGLPGRGGGAVYGRAGRLLRASHDGHSRFSSDGGR
jgi:hypothetical protein